MAWLLSWLWQGMAITLVVAALLRLAHRLNAATRYIIWWATLLTVLASPLIWVIDVGGATASASSAARGSSAAEASLLLPIVIPSVPDWILSIAIGGWLGLAAIRLFRVTRSFARVRQLKRGCIAMPPAREQRLRGWVAARSLGRRARLGLSDEVGLPSALGLGRPVIALPRTLAPDLARCRRLRQASATLDEARRAKSGGSRQLSDPDLDRIVLHELAHVRRYDDWARLAQSIVDALAGVHPAVWWIGRMLDLEREAACDDYVVARTGGSKQYAVCLTRTAELARSSGGWPALEWVLAPGAARAGRELARRVHRLLDQRRGRRPWPVAAAFGASAATAMAALVIVARLSACVVLVEATSIAAPDTTLAAEKPLVLSSQPALSVSNRVLNSPQGKPLRHAQGTRVAQFAAMALDDVPLAAAPVVLPGTPVVDSLADAPVDTPGVLAAAPIADRLGDGASLWPPVISDDRASDPPIRGPWHSVADAGVAVGSGMRAAGVATAAFFARAGASIAQAF